MPFLQVAAESASRTSEGPMLLSPRERFVAFALAAADLLVESTVEGTITYAAGAFESRLGRPPETWLQRRVHELIAPEERAVLETALLLLAAGRRLAPMPIRIAAPPGSRTPVMVLSGLPVPRSDGVLKLSLCFAALPVPLPAEPHVADGRLMMRDLEWRLRGRTAESSLSFFEVTGPDGPVSPQPELVAEIGRALAAEGGQGSLPGELAIGRYGLVQGSRAADLAALAERIEAVLSANGVEAHVETRSLALGESGLTPVQATRALRYALAAFSQGGTRALGSAGFEKGLPGFVATATATAEAMQRTLAERRFRLVFQPIVGLRDRQPHHFEALLRPVPTPGLPIDKVQEFVTFAEAVGLAEELDIAVVDSASRTLLNADDVRIACNVSGFSLESPEFRERLLGILDARAGLGPRLLIEITETAEIGDHAEAVCTLEALRARGVEICLDDFGAGASAFRYLHTFGAEYVKLDGLYVQGAARNERDRFFVTAILELANSLNAKVVAERIETEAEAHLMREFGVHLGQGYLFGPPGSLPGSTRWRG